MDSAKPIAPLRLVANTFGSEGRPNTRLVAGILIFSAIQIAVVLAGVEIDDSWVLGKTGLGLLRHYGAWAILISDPILLIATGYAYYRFEHTLLSLPIKSDAQSRNRVKRLLQRYMRWINARDFSAFGYVLCVVLGLLCWLYNMKQTENPTTVFLHDVFDAPPHWAGFYAYKLCLFVSWVIVYPIVGYVMVALSFSASAILAVIKREGLLDPHVTHPDSCFGLRDIGLLSICLVAPYLISYSVVFVLLFTHGHLYATISITLIAMTAIIMLTSYFVFAPTFALFKEARTKTYRHLLAADRNRTSVKTDDLEFAIERLCFGTSASSPYATVSSIVLGAMNLIPLLGIAVSFLGRWF